MNATPTNGTPASTALLDRGPEYEGIAQSNRNQSLPELPKWQGFGRKELGRPPLNRPAELSASGGPARAVQTRDLSYQWRDPGEIVEFPRWAPRMEIQPRPRRRDCLGRFLSL